MSLALLIASLVASAISGLVGLPSGLSTSINAIISVIGVLIKNGVGVSTTTESLVLTTLAGVIAALKATPGLPQAALNDIAILDDALNAALAQQSATTSVDPTKLNPITPLP